MEIEEINSPAVCTTQEAARLLGMSVTTVQQLVESGEIEAWKTKGGHRRIPIAAVHAYRALAGQTPLDREDRTEPRRTSILVVEDNEIQRGIYERQIAQWSLDADVRYCENGYQALVEIARHKPNVVLADIVMDGIDGYEVIKTVLSYNYLADMNIAILSSLDPEALEARGGIPPGVVFFPKPINYDELRGYLRACCAQTARRRRPTK